MRFWKVILDWWHARQRRIDVELLWPEITRRSSTEHLAREAFAVHAFHDPAWLALGHRGIIEAIERLPTKGLTT